MLKKTLFRELRRRTMRLNSEIEVSGPGTSERISATLRARWQGDESVLPSGLGLDALRETFQTNTSDAIDAGFQYMRVIELLAEGLSRSNNVRAAAAQGLVHGGVAVERAERRDACAEKVVAKIDEIAASANFDAVESSAPGYHAAIPALKHVGEIFCAHFKGADADTFHHTENSYLSWVIKHGRGIPLTLSIAFAALAERCPALAGRRISGCNFPARFLLRVEGDDDDAVSLPPLVGDFFSVYGIHGPEVVRSVRTADGGLKCTKITGDSFVPGGELTWRMPRFNEDRAFHEAELQLAEQGFKSPWFESCQIEALGVDRFVLRHAEGGDELVYERIRPSDPLFVDSFGNFRIMSRPYLLASLQGSDSGASGPRSSSKPVTPSSPSASILEPATPVQVLSRCARNLELAHEKGGESDRALVYKVAALELALSSVEE